jgi:hypothetical protein
MKKNVYDNSPFPEGLKASVELIETLARTFLQSNHRKQKLNFEYCNLKGSICCHNQNEVIVRFTEIWDGQHLSKGFDDEYELPNYSAEYFQGAQNDDGTFDDDWFYAWKRTIRVTA